MTGDDHNPQKLNFDFTFHGKIIIKFTSHRIAVDHDSRELKFFYLTLHGKIISQFTSHGNALDHKFTGIKFLISRFTEKKIASSRVTENCLPPAFAECTKQP